MVALIAAAYFYLLHGDASPAPQPAVPRTAEAVNAVAGQMTTALDAAGAALQGYERDEAQAARAALEQARADFEAALAQFSEVAATDAQRAQAQSLSERFAAAIKQAQTAMAALDARAERGAAFDRYRAEGAALISQQPPVAGRPNRGRTLRKQNIANDLNGQLRAKGREYAARAAGAPLPAAPNRTALLANISRYEVLTDTRAERDWAARARAWVEQGERQWSGATTGAPGQRPDFAEPQQAFASIQTFIAEQVQANLNADLADLEAQLAQRTAQAQAERKRTGQILLVLLGACALVALITMFAARAPLRRLAALTRPYVDSDLTYQMLALRGDESRELDVAVRWLIERLQMEVQPAPPPDERASQALEAFDQSRQPMAVLDAHKQVVHANAAFSELTGRDAASLTGTPIDAAWSTDHHDDASIEAMWALVQEQGEWQGELWIRDSSGNVHPLWGYLSRVRNAAGAGAGFILACSDVSAIRMAERQSARAADASLANATVLAQRLRAGSSRASRHGSHAALMHIAVAQLEGVDRILGREEADALMKVAAERLQRILRGHDAILRMADNQFVVLLEDVADAEQARRVAEKILMEFSVPVELSGLELPLHAKIGIALAPDDGSAEELPNAAREALVRAGHTRGAGFAFFAPELNERMWSNHALAAEMGRSDLESQLRLLYQPRVAAVDGQRMVGVQAVMRWLHPEHGSLAPERFLQAAPPEVVLRLDAWQIAQACMQLQSWGPGETLPLAVEILSRRPDADELDAKLTATLQRCALPPRLLELEFRVSMLAAADQCEALFTRLNASGVALSVIVDDVEAFTRSLGLLRRLPLTRVKLGRALVDGIVQGASEQAVTRATLTLARSLGVELVADGVETQAQSVFLRTEGILHQQGGLFGAPAAAQALDVHRGGPALSERSGAAV